MQNMSKKSKPTIKDKWNTLAKRAAIYLQHRSKEHSFVAAGGDGDITTLQKIVSAYPDAVTWVCPTLGHKTALISAAFHQKNDAIKFLIDKGANVDAQDSGGYTALGWAAYWRHKDTMQSLLMAGARTDIKTHKGETVADLIAFDKVKSDRADYAFFIGYDPFEGDEDRSVPRDDLTAFSEAVIEQRTTEDIAQATQGLRKPIKFTQPRIQIKKKTPKFFKD